MSLRSDLTEFLLKKESTGTETEAQSLGLGEQGQDNLRESLVRKVFVITVSLASWALFAAVVHEGFSLTRLCPYLLLVNFMMLAIVWIKVLSFFRGREKLFLCLHQI